MDQVLHWQCQIQFWQMHFHHLHGQMVSQTIIFQQFNQLHKQLEMLQHWTLCSSIHKQLIHMKLTGVMFIGQMVQNTGMILHWGCKLVHQLGNFQIGHQKIGLDLTKVWLELVNISQNFLHTKWKNVRQLFWKEQISNLQIHQINWLIMEKLSWSIQLEQWKIYIWILMVLIQTKYIFSEGVYITWSWINGRVNGLNQQLQHHIKIYNHKWLVVCIWELVDLGISDLWNHLDHLQDCCCSVQVKLLSKMLQSLHWMFLMLTLEMHLENMNQKLVIFYILFIKMESHWKWLWQQTSQQNQHQFLSIVSHQQFHQMVLFRFKFQCLTWWIKQTEKQKVKWLDLMLMQLHWQRVELELMDSLIQIQWLEHQ